jgi:hypothetical protein
MAVHAKPGRRIQCTSQIVHAKRSCAPDQHNEIVDVFASLWYLWLAHAKERKVHQTSTKGVRLEIKRLEACIQEVNETRVAPFEDRLREMLAADFDAAWASPIGTARNAAYLEIEDLWRQVDQLNDVLKGRRPRGVTFN